MQRLISKHILYIIITLLIVLSTLFIPNKIQDYSAPVVRLGYPIHFIAVNFKNSYPDFPNQRQKDTEFNILSIWEKSVETSWVNLIMSLGITFIILKILAKTILKLSS